MAGYIGSKSSVTLVDGYTRTEADAEFVQTAGDTMTGSLSINGDLTVDTDTLFVDAANNQVGVGTSSPNTGIKLDVEGNIRASGAIAIGYTGTLTQLDVNGSAYIANDLYLGDKIIHIGDTNTAIRFPANDTVAVETAGSERMRIDSAGRVTKPYQPAFDAYAPAVTGQGAYVVYGATRSNVGNHYSTTTGGFTAPVAGHYHFTFNSLMVANASQSYVRLYLDINGTRGAQFGDTLAGGTTTAWTGWSYYSIMFSLTTYLNANDVVAVWNDGPYTTYGTSYGAFSGYLVG